MWIIWKIGAVILFKTNMAGKNANVSFSGLVFLYVRTFITIDDSKERKIIRLSPSSQSEQFT